MEVDAQVLDNGAIEVQFGDRAGRVGHLRIDPERILDKGELEEICNLLNMLSDRRNVRWIPIFDKKQLHVQAECRPIDESQSRLWQTCTLPELRKELQARVEEVTDWLVRARELLKKVPAGQEGEEEE